MPNKRHVVNGAHLSVWVHTPMTTANKCQCKNNDEYLLISLHHLHCNFNWNLNEFSVEFLNYKIHTKKFEIRIFFILFVLNWTLGIDTQMLLNKFIKMKNFNKYFPFFRAPIDSEFLFPLHYFSARFILRTLVSAPWNMCNNYMHNTVELPAGWSADVRHSIILIMNYNNKRRTFAGSSHRFIAYRKGSSSSR